MRIIHLVPGSGGSFYCGNCMRDTVYINALKDLGHDVVMVPLYLPLNVNDFGNFGNSPVFFGAISLYMRQQFRVFRHMPQWLEKFFDSPKFLKLAAKKAGSTRASGLEDMTISMLEGEEGIQNQNITELVDWLKSAENKPDIIHISNALLIGMAKRVKKEVNVPVVCTLQDEDVWLDVMDEPYKSHCWSLIEQKSQHVDAFVAVSNYFAEYMQQRIPLPKEKVNVVRPGIDVRHYDIPQTKPKYFTIGYLSRLCKANGLDILIDAFIELKKESGYEDVKLKLTGGFTGDDIHFLKEQKRNITLANLDSEVEFVDDFYGDARANFLESISLLSVPVRGGEALGVYQLEALATGVPLLQPNEGAFTEIVSQTKGGWLYEPNTSDNLTLKLKEILSNRSEAEKRGLHGRESLQQKFNSTLMAQDILKVYDKL